MKRVYFLQPSSTRDGLWMEKAFLDFNNIDFILTVFCEDYLDGKFGYRQFINEKEQKIAFCYKPSWEDEYTDYIVEYTYYEII